MFPRTSGILLHPTSLPGDFGIGDLGEIAYQFVDFLAGTGQKLWQVMPLGPTGFGDSPYACLSAFAGNHLLISPEKLVEEGFLSAEAPSLQEYPAFSHQKVEFEAVAAAKKAVLQESFAYFNACASATAQKRFANYCTCSQNRSWLHNYALFMAIKQHHEGKCWDTWEPGLIAREPAVMAHYEAGLTDEIAYFKYTQFLFYHQWTALKDYAHLNGIQIVGDMPIFLAHDSADVWAFQSLFHLDELGKPTAVAGVPPDYFSATGQLWGNPLYNWKQMAETHYVWWIKRFRTLLNLVDVIRIDHFRGFEAYWEVPAGEETAINGKWVKGPDKGFFQAMEKALGTLPFIAEDLGVITPPVEDLRDSFGFPGMKVLQFAFDTDSYNAFLPHGYDKNTVVYTGTHDNQTSVSWFESRTPQVQEFACNYLDCQNTQQIHWYLIKAAMSATSNTCLIPLQDILGLNDEQGRMNTPGKADGNWSWRFEGHQIDDTLIKQLLHLTKLYGR